MLIECDGTKCAGVTECPYHRVDALRRMNAAREAEMELVLQQTEDLTAQLEKVDIKAASRRAARKSAKAS